MLERGGRHDLGTSSHNKDDKQRQLKERKRERNSNTGCGRVYQITSRM